MKIFLICGLCDTWWFVIQEKRGRWAKQYGWICEGHNEEFGEAEGER